MANKTMEEYYQNFIELMRFAQSLVPREEIKEQKFEQGLSLELQQKLGGKA